MTADELLGPSRWRVYLGSMRAVVACSCMIHTASVLGNWKLAAVYGLYALYAITSLARSFPGSSHALFNLMVDTVLFLVASWFAGDAGIWLILLFYFYLLLAAAIQHRPAQVALVFAVCFLFFFLARPVRTAMMAPSLLLSGIAISLVSIRKKGVEERLAAANRQVVLLRSDAESARESERQRIAADFHDGPLQHFVGLQMRLQVIKQLIERDLPAGLEELRQVEELVRSQSAELRAFVRSMRPIEMDEAGLMPSLRRLLENFEKESGIAVTFVGGQADSKPETARELLQICREALHNVQKHSRATRVAVTAGRNGVGLEISIEDDGRGFPFSGSFSLNELEALRMGPVSIRRRVRSLGGDLQLESVTGRGATLKIRVGG